MGETLKGIPTRQHKVTMILDLAIDVEAQWRTFNAKLRNQIRKAQKSGLQFVAGHLELLDGFYEVFARNMRDLGTPVYAKNFFHNILEAFPESTSIFAVYHKQESLLPESAPGLRTRWKFPGPRPSAITRYSVLTTCSIGKRYGLLYAMALIGLTLADQPPTKGHIISKDNGVHSLSSSTGNT